MRILFVAMANSIHTARWIEQLRGEGWDIHLFPAEDAHIHPELREVTVHDLLYQRSAELDRSVPIIGGWPFPRGANGAKRIVRRFAPTWSERSRRLARTIKALRPDIVHSMEIQHAGYLTLAAREHLGGTFPPWMVANWGSDIYLFGQLAEHNDRIKAVLAACDYYNCECHRDVILARKFGLRGEVFPVLPVTGGLNIEGARRLRQPGPTSSRRLIALKGYQHFAGRALVGLRAVELCANALAGYRIALYSAAPEVQLAAELLTRSTGLPIAIVPHGAHEAMLRLHGQARVSLGLSISDSISTSVLEAMTMGSFPIQSYTGCANEWFRDGEGGLLVHPEDPEGVAAALRRAVADDALVDRAAMINAGVVAARLDHAVVRPQVVAMYNRILAEQGGPKASYSYE